MAASIGGALTRLRRDGLEHLLSFDHFEQLCRNHGQVWRRRLLTPAAMLRLLLLQVLHGNVAINALRQLSGMSFAAASFCQARTRLSLAALQRLLAEVSRAQVSRAASCGAASRQRIFIADSANFSIPDLPALRDRFGLPAPSRPGVSYPMGMGMGLLDAASGLFVRAAVFNVLAHDQRGVIAVHDALRPGDVLVGDRAFCAFCHVALLNRRGVFCCFRLHQKRPGQQLGVVRWRQRCRRPVWMSQSQFDSMPAELPVRIVRQAIEHKGYRSKVVLLATTLMDQDAWSDERVAGLYRQRWQIETCFAHLKSTMKMGVLKCKSVDGVLKELAVYLLVYNLVRLIMLRWAPISGVNIWRVSFIDALRLLSVRAMGLSGVDTLIVNPDRTGRRQLRVRRRRPRHYTWLTHPRSEQPDIAWFKRRA